MILRDEVTVLRTNDLLSNGAIMADPQIAEALTVPANVSYRSTSDPTELGRGYTQAQSLVAQIEPLPDDLDPAHHNIEWRGRRYALDGESLIRRRGAEDHHWTVPLQRTTG